MAEPNDTPSLLRQGRSQLSALERAQIWAIRRSLEPGKLSNFLRLCQRYIGTAWISWATGKLRRTHQLERVPAFSPQQSFILICNHRSFFDLYVVTTELLLHGVQQRIVFPVRSNFFYDSVLGFFVNGVMSFFAMYPPIFRDPKRASLNLVGLQELAALLRQGGYFAGIHPEGRRNKGDDPYTLLPGQSGIGRLIYEARVPVIPVFTNGLRSDNLFRQVKGNFDGTGRPIHTVFGEPLALAAFYEQEPSFKLYRAIAGRCIEVLEKLGAEERELRQRSEAGELSGLPSGPRQV